MKPQKTESRDMLDVLLEKSENEQQSLVIESKRKTAYRKGDSIIIPAYPKTKPIKQNVNIKTSCEKLDQLYKLKDDWGQGHNLAKKHTEISVE